MSALCSKLPQRISSRPIHIYVFRRLLHLGAPSCRGDGAKMAQSQVVQLQLNLIIAGAITFYFTNCFSLALTRSAGIKRHSVLFYY
jgi:hypothetical protein